MSLDQIYALRRLGVIMCADPNNPDEAMGVLNPGLARARDGELYLFPRIVAAGNYSRIGIARVIFGADGNPVDVERMGYVLEPTESFEQNAVTAGCEDARVVFVAPLNRYIMTYTAYGPIGPRVALAHSDDLLHWERLGPAKFRYAPALGADFDLYDNKDAFLFPELVSDPQGRPALAMMHRPSHVQGFHQNFLSVVPANTTETRASMWISYCSLNDAQNDLSNLCHWRDHQLVAVPEQPWEALKIGGGTPPVRTDAGWLMIYHGVSGRILPNVSQQRLVHYSAAALVLDANDPRKVIYRSPEPILSPETEEERKGTVPNVVFPTGIDTRENGRVDVYYGMADAAIGVATMNVARHDDTQH
jgi:predicted GH43/DUF377 family glycosyl hydrolase